MMRKFLLFLTIGLAASASAQTPMAAQKGAAPVCAAVPAAPPPEFARWSRADAVVAAADGTTPGTLAIGRSGRVTLVPTAQLKMPVSPEKPGAAGTHGGVLRFQVPRGGTYRIGLSAPAWIDVVQDGKAVASTAHGHGPDCSGIRKIVNFPLRPGTATLQLSGSSAGQITAMVVPAR